MRCGSANVLVPALLLSAFACAAAPPQPAVRTPERLESQERPESSRTIVLAPPTGAVAFYESAGFRLEFGLDDFCEGLSESSPELPGQMRRVAAATNSVDLHRFLEGFSSIIDWRMSTLLEAGRCRVTDLRSSEVIHEVERRTFNGRRSGHHDFVSLDGREIVDFWDWVE